jgi:hypothetical protein
MLASPPRDGDALAHHVEMQLGHHPRRAELRSRSTALNPFGMHLQGAIVHRMGYYAGGGRQCPVPDPFPAGSLSPDFTHVFSTSRARP